METAEEYVARIRAAIVIPTNPRLEANMRAAVELAIRDGIKLEREACARTCEALGTVYATNRAGHDAVKACTEAIRLRA